MRNLLFIVILLLPCLAMAENFSPAETDQFLEKLASERKNIPGVEKKFREEKQSGMMTKPVISTGTLCFQSPNKFRRETDGQNKSLTVSNGETLWLYYPSLKEAEFYNLKGRSPVRDSISAMLTSLNFQDLKQNFRYTMHSTNNGWEILLEPKNSSLRRIFRHVSIHLDKERRVEKLELSSETGDKTTTIFQDEKERRFPDDYFSFTPPPGVEVSKPLGD